jgi:hypothetical protein
MTRYLKGAIWLYIILLMFEGALRKWVIPGYSTPLLIIRDPVLLLIYALALMSGIVPRTRFMVFLGVITLLSFAFALLSKQPNLFVTLYGIRTNYLHVPLIWVIGEAFKRRDVENVGVFFLAMSVAMTALMVMQFKAPIDAWINRGIGEDEMGQIYGAAGHIRPPGFFTFITGPMVFFPLATAFFLHALTKGKQDWWRILLIVAAGLSIAIALPVSISRGTMIGTVLVIAVFVLTLFKIGILNASALRLGAMGLFLMVGLSFLPIFKEARDVFMDRWDTAAAEVDGNAVGSLVSRVLKIFVQPFDTMERTPPFGYGIGVGTNAGAAMLAGQTGFLLAEDEWDRVIMELGPMLGLAYIIFRAAIVVYLGILALRALWRDNDILPLLIFSACAYVILLNQWGQPTQLGFAVLGGGLLMAALNYDDLDDDEDGEDAEDEDIEPSEDFADDEEPSQEIAEHEARRRRMRGQ